MVIEVAQVYFENVTGSSNVNDICLRRDLFLVWLSDLPLAMETEDGGLKSRCIIFIHIFSYIFRVALNKVVELTKFLLT